MKSRNLFRHLLAAATIALTAGTSFAQNHYPNRPITIVVPFQAGGGVDAVARKLAEALRPALNQPVVVDNKPGGSGMIGAHAVARATPDGYTILLGSAGETAINPHIHKGKMTYDAATELSPITLIAEVPNVLVVNPKLPAGTLDELIAHAKQSRHPLTYATSGVGNMQHLNGELLASLAGVELLHVPYRGAAGQLTDVVSGQVDMSFVSYAAAIGFIDSERLRAIAVSSDTRIEAAPDIPAIAETEAYAEYSLANWFGLFVTAGTPEPVQETLHTAVVAALADPEMQRFLKDQGFSTNPMSRTDFRAFVETQSATFAEIVERANITAE